LLAVTLPDVPLDSRTPSVTLCLFSSRCNVDLNRVQLELAREIVPGAQKIGIVNNSIDVKARGQWDEIESVTPNLDIKVTSADVLKPEDIEPAFKKLGAEHVEVVVVLQSNLLVLERARIATTAAATRPPTVYGYREQVEAGGLISYGVNLYSGFHRAASYVYKILKGIDWGSLGRAVRPVAPDPGARLQYGRRDLRSGLVMLMCTTRLTPARFAASNKI
jgi:ABC transporter substrate binding protein